MKNKLIDLKIILAFSVAFAASPDTYSQVYGDGVTDLDGNQYTTVVIGGQEWMAENLKTTKYSNGNEIANVTNSADWSTLYSGAWAYFQNDQGYDSLYGKLYNFFTVEDSRNVCPAEWIVPSVENWETLENYLGGYEVAGSKLKITGTAFWSALNTDATNETGFSGYPGGSRMANGGFPGNIMSPYATWWISTADNNFQPWYKDLDCASSYVGAGFGSKTGGLPIRCLKNGALSTGSNGETREFLVFPNPATDFINIQANSASEIIYSVYDVNGKILMEGSTSDFSINISNLESGFYYLRLSCEQVNSVVKLIKQ